MTEMANLGHSIDLLDGSLCRVGECSGLLSTLYLLGKMSFPQPQMQMGPALLPTPLSPARGRLVFHVWSGKPSLPRFSLRTWRPVSTRVQLRLSCSTLAGFPFPSPPCFAVRHRCSRRHPTLLRIGASALFWSKPPLCYGMPLGIAEAAILGLTSRTLVSDCPRALTQQLLSAIITALNGCFASLLFQTIRLAFDQGLLHCVSQELRGQQSPYLCFEKPS